jgi:hypothetical protein
MPDITDRLQDECRCDIIGLGICDPCFAAAEIRSLRHKVTKLQTQYRALYQATFHPTPTE